VPDLVAQFAVINHDAFLGTGDNLAIELLALAQSLFRPLALGDIRKEALQVLDAVLFISAYGPCSHPNPSPVFASPPVLHLARLLVPEGRLQSLLDRVKIIGMN